MAATTSTSSTTFSSTGAATLIIVAAGASLTAAAAGLLVLATGTTGLVIIEAAFPASEDPKLLRPSVEKEKPWKDGRFFERSGREERP
jgi:hypothetical protein